MLRILCVWACLLGLVLCRSNTLLTKIQIALHVSHIKMLNLYEYENSLADVILAQPYLKVVFDRIDGLNIPRECDHHNHKTICHTFKRTMTGATTPIKAYADILLIDTELSNFPSTIHAVFPIKYAVSYGQIVATLPSDTYPSVVVSVEHRNFTGNHKINYSGIIQRLYYDRGIDHQSLYAIIKPECVYGLCISTSSYYCEQYVIAELYEDLGTSKNKLNSYGFNFMSDTFIVLCMGVVFIVFILNICGR